MKHIITLLLLLSFSIPAFSQWQPSSGPQGGKIFTIAQIGDELWAGTTGGLYTSDDNGEQWTLSGIVSTDHWVLDIFAEGEDILIVTVLKDPLENISGNYLYKSSTLGQSWEVVTLPSSVSPKKVCEITKVDNIIYLDTGATHYRSTDDGVTWTVMPIGSAVSTAYGTAFQWADVNQKLFRSINQGIGWNLYLDVDVVGDIFLKEDLLVFQSSDSLLHISQDAGNNWDMVAVPGDFTPQFWQGDDGKLYALGRIAHYVSQDDGFTWTALPADQHKNAINDAIATNQQLFAASTNGVWKLADGGSSWTSVSEGLINGNLANMYVAPNGSRYISSRSGNYRSDDGGANWTAFEPEIFDTWLHDLAFDGNTTYAEFGTLYKSDGGDFVPISPPAINDYIHQITFHDGKIYRPVDEHIQFSADQGANWDTLNTPSCFSCFWTDIEFAGSNIIILNNQQAGFTSTDNGNNWTQSFQPASISQQPRRKRYFQVGSRLYVAGNNTILSSADDGVTWSAISAEGLPNSVPLFDLAGNETFLFASVGAKGVYVSGDQGAHFYPYNGGLVVHRARALQVIGDKLYLCTNINGLWERDMDVSAYTGIVYLDANNNGIRDPGEGPLSQVIVKSDPDEFYSSTVEDGTYNVLSEFVANTLTAIHPSPYANVNPPFHTVQGTATSYDFGVYLDPDINDLCITLTHLTPFRPGFNNTIQVSVKNVGTSLMQNPTVIVELDSLLTYLSADLLPSIVSGTTLTWNLAPMASGDCININVTVNLSQEAVIGYLLHVQGDVTPIVDDMNSLNNRDNIFATVVGSYDPNDKAVEPGVFITPEQLSDGQRLVYTIRFQNTGNFYAEIVRVIDTISTNLDLATFQFLSSSHPCVWYIRSGRAIEFVFDDIFLPDSTTNEPESHGFVKFSIKPVGELLLGDMVDNFADIFFDFNDPIRTNTATIAIENEVRVSQPAESDALVITPNPNHGVFRVSLSTPVSREASLEITDAQGKLILRQVWAAGQTTANVNLPGSTTGVYFVKWKAGEEVLGRQVLIEK
jgi:uncharacterized repeat protein (TIGR01451 family)